MSVSRRSALTLVLRFPLGLGVLGVGSSTAGALTVALLIWLSGASNRLGDGGVFSATVAVGYIGFAMVVGIVASTILQRRAITPLRVRGELNVEAAGWLRRLPLHMTLLSGVLWLGGLIVVGLTSLSVIAVQDVLAGLVLGVLGGIATTSFTFLIVERAVRPVMGLALAAYHGRRGTVFARLAITWALTGGVPLSYVVLVLTYSRSAPFDRIRAAVFIAAFGLFVGVAATALLTRAVASPLRGMRFALEKIARGQLDVTVEVNDSSEIGLLQSSVNDLARGLRERERMRDLFDRHVGASVADHAMEYGASLEGDVVRVTALFVDVMDSTALAYRLPAKEFVEKINRLLTAVVSATERHGGLVNKFEGDAALCVFGAPVPLADAATAALCAARQIRDAVRAAEDLDIGIGLATGPVFAGQLGTSRRLEYTVIGDAVNQAARLTDEAKHVPGRVLAGQATIDAASATERANWSEHARIRLRGRENPTMSWTSDPESNQAPQPDYCAE